MNGVTDDNCIAVGDRSNCRKTKLMNSGNLRSVIELVIGIVKFYRTLEACRKCKVISGNINLCPLGLAVSHNPNLTVIGLSILVCTVRFLCSHYGIIFSFCIGRIDVEHKSGCGLNVVIEIHSGHSMFSISRTGTSGNLDSRSAGNANRSNNVYVEAVSLSNVSVDSSKRNIVNSHTVCKSRLKLCYFYDGNVLRNAVINRFLFCRCFIAEI